MTMKKRIGDGYFDRHHAGAPAGSVPMSAIGSVGSTNSSSLLYQLYLQSLQPTSQVAGLTGTAALLGSQPSDSSGGTSTSSSSDGASTTGAAASGSSTSPANLTDLRSQIESAVTEALSNVGAASTPGDLLQTVHNAIDSTLQANGINPQQLRGHGHHGHHHHAAADGSQSTNSSQSSTNGASSDADGDSDGSSANTSQGQDLLAILSLLGNQGSPPGSSNYSSGTNSTLTQPTSLAAVLASSSTTANGGLDLTSLFGQLFSSFPSGSGLNVQA
jgi:trimeric autotransporter adhesin